MRVTLTLLPILAIGLASCGSEPDPIPAADIAAEAENLVKPLPGQYKNSTKLVSLESPNLPAETASALKADFERRLAGESTKCVTEEMAEEGFEKQIEQLANMGNGVTCNFTKFDADGGTLDAALACSGPQGMSIAMQMDGQVEPEKQIINNTLAVDLPILPGTEMEIGLEATIERIGDCPAGG